MNPRGRGWGETRTGIPVNEARSAENRWRHISDPVANISLIDDGKFLGSILSRGK